MNSSLADLSARQLRRAAAVKDKIQLLENELRRILGSPGKVEAAKSGPKKRKMSAAARAKIASAAKARWAKFRAAKKR